MNYDEIFYWIGVISSGFFVLLGISIFSGWIMNLVWCKFKDGKKLAEIIGVWREHEKIVNKKYEP